MFTLPDFRPETQNCVITISKVSMCQNRSILLSGRTANHCVVSTPTKILKQEQHTHSHVDGGNVVQVTYNESLGIKPVHCLGQPLCPGQRQSQTPLLSHPMVHVSGLFIVYWLLVSLLK